MPNFMRSITIWLIFGVVLIVLFNLSQGGLESNGHDRLDFSDFLAKVNAGEVLAALQSEGLGIVDVSTHEADLEDVFLNLTRAPAHG